MSKPVTLTVTFDISDHARRALRFRKGERGKATAKEIDSYIHMCVDASVEDICHDYENRTNRRRRVASSE